MFFEGGIFVSSMAFCFDDFNFYCGMRLGSGVTWAPLLGP